MYVLLHTFILNSKNIHFYMYWYVWRKTTFLIGHFNKVTYNETHLLHLFLFELVEQLQLLGNWWMFTWEISCENAVGMDTIENKSQILSCNFFYYILHLFRHLDIDCKKIVHVCRVNEDKHHWKWQTEKYFITYPVLVVHAGP